MLSTTNLDIRGHFLSNNLRLGFTKIIAIIIEVQFGIKNKSTAMRVFTKNADVLKILSVPNVSAPFTCSVSRNNNNMTKLILKSPLYSAKGQSCVASKLFFQIKPVSANVKCLLLFGQIIGSLTSKTAQKCRLECKHNETHKQ